MRQAGCPSVVLFAAACLAASSAAAEGFFAGLDISGGTAFGKADGKDGGAPWAGGSEVTGLRFGPAIGVGGYAGYRINSAFALSASYQHLRGSIGWEAEFPRFGVTSIYAGTAATDLILGHASYHIPLGNRSAVELKAGAGLAINTLSSVAETDKGTGIFLADVENGSRTNAAGQLGVGLSHHFTSKVALGLSATASYVGGFETGDSRSGNLGVTPIVPYRIDDVWRINLGGTLRVRF